MCIICAKEIGIDMPTETTMRTMWQNNEDGAGIMWNENGQVFIHKGFMKYDDFKKFVDELSERIDLKNTGVVMHFRITTHGGTKPENCHPFPISDNPSNLQKLVFHTDLGVAHNGIIHNTPRTGISDTMEYIITNLSYMKRINSKFYREKVFQNFIYENINSSRMAFLNGNGEIYTIGDFITEDGLMYSCGSYKPAYYSYYYKTPTCYSGLYNYGTAWDYDYDYSKYYLTSEDDTEEELPKALENVAEYFEMVMPIDEDCIVIDEDTGAEITGQVYLDQAGWAYTRDDELDAIIPIYDYVIVYNSDGEDVTFDWSKAENQRVIELDYAEESEIEDDEYDLPEICNNEKFDFKYETITFEDESFMQVCTMYSTDWRSAIRSAQHIIGKIETCSDIQEDKFGDSCWLVTDDGKEYLAFGYYRTISFTEDYPTED